ncbi:dihydrodipicolinate reductase C-terminal domain-containing protein [Holospora curviuscula]|uniref:4-hydroxy-tetrahydrodipicolinate reductase n=1 Tax=Holospora curviuscula TaxID=1082868 RepID=A0A2S5R7H8_9PROT|nr:dihydrodipicolinate reductase C-terminal domain-containing protein [Holospora curviuscula]PPE03296.1 4-hydroxy-tetrahydrodipicolinate reductase [Holospora curviuscula]
MRVGVFGGLGRLGTEVVALAKSYPGINEILIKDSKQEKNKNFISFDEFMAKSDVIIDTSCAEGTKTLIDAISSYSLVQNINGHKKKALIIGSTGHKSDVKDIVDDILNIVPVLYAPNAAQSLWYFLRSVTLLAKTLGPSWDVHIKDHHHKHKRDTPSGTVMYFIHHLESICPWLHKKIQWNSVRAGTGMILNSVLFSGNNEIIECTHQVLEVGVFAKGLLDMAHWIKECSPGYYDIQCYINYQEGV